MESFEGLSDEKLACKAQAGHSSAFDLLVRRHRDRILRHLSLKTRHEQDAEDLTQETFLKACKNLHRYDPGRPFSAWGPKWCPKPSDSRLPELCRIFVGHE